MAYRAFLVKVTKCSGEHYWYKGLEGTVFEVYQVFSDDYVLKEDYDNGHDKTWHHLLISDCEVVN